MLKKIFCWVSILQGLILTLVYPQYVNTEHSGRKDRIKLIYKFRKINILLFNIDTDGITKKEYTVSQ